MIKKSGQFCYMCMRKILPYLSFVVIISGVMVFLMWSVYTIPAEKIRENASKSAEILLQEPMQKHSYNRLIVKGVTDVTTDAVMLNIASFFGYGSALSDSLLHPRMYYLNSPILNFAISVKNSVWEKEHLSELSVQTCYSYVNDNVWDTKIFIYPRFWHGYLIFLKPLLLVFDIGEIRIINFLWQFGLLVIVLCLIYKRLGLKEAIIYFSSILCLDLLTSWQCLEYANVMNVMFLASLWVLLNKNPDDKYMFFVIGAVTILFDFLTFPLITLGIPLILYILLYERSLKQNFICVFKNSLLWGCGYGVMMAMKWILATIITQYNVIDEGLQNVLHRISGQFENGYFINSLTYENVLRANFAEFYSLNELIMWVVLCLLVIFFCYYKFERNAKAVVLVLIALMPFVWYRILLNHSAIHSFIVYKILTIAVYAVLSAVTCCLRPVVKEKYNDKKAK